MAEPLFIVADIDLSAPALRRWLKSAPQSVAAFDDWPESVRLGAPGITELAAPVEPCVADALVSYCVDSFDGKMGICTAGTTSRRMRSGSRRASSMAMRPAPRRPRFSLRPAARAGAGLHGKAALIHPPVQRRRRSGLHRDRQAVLARPACSGACASLAPMVRRLISQDNLGDPGRLMVALFPPWPAP